MTTITTKDLRIGDVVLHEGTTDDAAPIIYDVVLATAVDGPALIKVTVERHAYGRVVPEHWWGGRDGAQHVIARLDSNGNEWRTRWTH